MKKKFLFALLVTLTGLMLMSTSVFALTEGDWEFQLLDNEVTITKYIGNDENIIMPDTIYGAPVTKIDRDVFSRSGIILKNHIVSLKVSKGIKELPDYFMRGSNSLQKIELPEGLISMGTWAFQDNTSLTEVKLPSTLERIGQWAFDGCTSLKKVNFPASLRSFGEFGGFTGTGLEEVDMSQCVNLKNLSSSLFADCKALRKVILPPAIIEIPHQCFKGCSSLTEIKLDTNISVIGYGAFDGCTAFENIILPISLKEIRGTAFSNCAGLKEVVIPYGVEKLRNGSWGGPFTNCVNLKSLYIPDTVTELGDQVISGSTNCIIYCNSDSPVAEICKKRSISYLTDKSVNSGITVLYNGTRVSFHSYDQNPELINSRTLVPLRSIFEAMGADVEWVGETSTVIATRNGVEITLQIGSNTVVKNNENITIDTPPMLLNDRTMVPVRVIAEAFGADVEWHNAGRTVIITE